MANLFTKFIHSTASAVNALFGADGQVNYQVLSRSILAINQCQTLENILCETYQCLKRVLNYQMVAIVVHAREQIEVWIDPRICQEPLRHIILRDLGSAQPPRFHDLDERMTGPEPPTFRNRKLISYSLAKANGMVRIYMLPDRRKETAHRDVLKIIVQAVSVAMDHYLSIKRLENNLSLDPLTGCYNRREFDRLMGHQIAGAKRHDKGISLIMLDIDHFKRVNDTFGHPAGDKVLKTIAAEILGAIRDGDYLIRYGGEEFAVMLPNTKMPRAIELANRLRQVIENLTITLPDGQQISKTASFGVATLRTHDDLNSLVKAADVALYQAKAAGRNRVMPDLHVVTVETPSFSPRAERQQARH